MAEPIRSPIHVPLQPANQTWTMPAQNRLSTYLIRRVRVEAFAAVAGTLYIEESDDSAFGASTTLATITLVADTSPTPPEWVKLSKKWYRLRYVNGASAQTSVMDCWLEKDDREIQDVEVTGSLPAFAANPSVVPVTSTGLQVSGTVNAAAPTGVVLVGYNDGAGSGQLKDWRSGYSDAMTKGNVPAIGTYGFNGDTWDRKRVANVSKQNSGSVATIASLTIWTPAAGKKFRLLGVIVSVGVTGNYTLLDNTGTIYDGFFLANTPCVITLPSNGYLSAAINNAFSVKNQTAGAAGVAAWALGTEE